MNVIEMFELEDDKKKVMGDWKIMQNVNETEHIENLLAGTSFQTIKEDIKQYILNNHNYTNEKHNFEMERVNSNNKYDLSCNEYNVYYNVKHLCNENVIIENRKIFIINALIENCNHMPLLSFTFLRNMDKGMIEIPFVYENDKSKLKGRVESFFSIDCEEDGFIEIEDTLFYLCHHVIKKTNIREIKKNTKWIYIYASECMNEEKVMNCAFSEKIELLKKNDEVKNIFQLINDKNDVYPMGKILYNVTEYSDFVTYYNLLIEKKESILLKIVSEKMNIPIISMIKSCICFMNYENALHCVEINNKYKIFRCHVMIMDEFLFEINKENDLNKIIIEMQLGHQCIAKKDMNYVIFDMIDKRNVITDRIE